MHLKIKVILDILGTFDFFLSSFLRMGRSVCSSVFLLSHTPVSSVDESPTTCRVFLNEGGLDLFLGVLVTFAGEATVETKVLGLVNNIAEVPELRIHLLKASFLQLLR